MGRIDIFCSNAGIAELGDEAASNASWQRNWDIHVMAHVYAARLLAPRMAERGEGYLRVGVQNGGCAGMEYMMDYVSEISPLDEVVEDKDVQIVVDAKAVLFILGSEIDYDSRFVQP